MITAIVLIVSSLIASWAWQVRTHATANPRAPLSIEVLAGGIALVFASISVGAGIQLLFRG